MCPTVENTKDFFFILLSGYHVIYHIRKNEMKVMYLFNLFQFIQEKLIVWEKAVLIEEK